MTWMMRTVLAAVLLLAAAAPAAAEVWCLRGFGNTGGACVFPSGRECAAAARFSAFGGVCERQPLAPGERTDGKADPDRRSSRLKGAERW